MLMTITLSDFRTEWAKSSRYQSFSYEGLEILFDFLEETTPDYDLDIVELDSTYAESSLEDLINDYGYALDKDEEDGEPTLEDFLELLENKTTVCGVTSDDKVVYIQF